MRTTLFSLPVLALAISLLAACGSTVVGGGSGGSGGASTTSANPTTSTAVTTSTSVTSTSVTTSSSAVTTSSSAVTTSTSSGAGCLPDVPLSGACAPKAVCSASGSTCLAHVDQSAATVLDFRMAQLDFTAPVAFTQGIVKSVFEGNVTPSDPACNLNGSATFSWLLRFDTAAGTLTTGGSKPVPVSSGPYAFVDAMFMNGTNLVHVAPVTVPASVTGCAFSSNAGDVVIPMFLDAQGFQSVLLPLRALRFFNGTLSASRGCIGRYNAEGLDPANSCLPDFQHSAFVDGASLDAFISLEDADGIVVAPLSETLCVMLSGNAAQYGDGTKPVQKCKRDANNQIVFEGDWCAATNQAASPSCADAVRVAATFAAQAVQVQ
jgi:hypothetical protein